MTLQEIILALEKFWADHGCIIQQPCDIEVGAGTFNPATFLRCLGPEPWQAAYVEPVRRPTDGRYAENPFRLGAYYQYQVLLKPAPENVLPLYLESLYHLGISPRKNDIRFVEDDWESPTLGASGLGWEVWWNGAEVTQFTYFQQMGSIELAPISAEITYGLERIALYLQDVDTFFDIRWNENLTYGDVHRQSEVEYSIYNFEHANVEMLFELFGTYEKETQACLKAGLVLPATDHVLRCSHTFNMLDARGVISVTERMSYIERVRRLAQRTAWAYVDQREEMGLPLLKRSITSEGPPRTASSTSHAVAETSNCPVPDTAQETTTLLFEIGTEEIPASYIPPALEQLSKIATDSLTEHRIPFGDIQTFGTPRRITLAIKKIKTLQESQETEVMGPPKRIAYDENGEPTKAAIGFAKTQGVDLSALRIIETERGEYVAVSKIEKGIPTREVLQTLLPEWIGALCFPKTMSCWKIKSTKVMGPPKRIAYDENGEPTEAAIDFAKRQGVDLSALRIIETERGEYVAVEKTKSIEVMGPSTRIAYDENGEPTKVAIDFAKRQGVDLSALRTVKTKREEYVAVTVPGAYVRFARPIRWLVTLLGDEVINCTYGAVNADRITYGHRSLHPNPITLEAADLETYIQELRDAAVIVCPKERRGIIEKQVRTVLETEGCLPKIDAELLDTVNYIVENPQPIVGNFSESHLQIPPEMLITAMKKHQRYFPMWKSETVLASKFVTISNGTDGNIDGVRHGNERVLHARLNDVEFFYKEDQKTSLADKVQRLGDVVFHAETRFTVR